MSTLTGILVDVSGSMKNSSCVGNKVDEDGGTWAKSIFNVVDELIKQDTTPSNQTFALAFGGSSHPGVFDLLTAVSEAQEDQSSIENLRSRKSKEELIDDVLQILEENGASRVRTWAKMDVLRDVVDDKTAASILHFLQKSSDFTKKFVYDCLPEECRAFLVKNIRNEALHYMVGWVPVVGSDLQASGTRDSVTEVIEKGERLVAETMLGVSKAAIKSVSNASEILHASIGDQELTDERVNELLKAVKPYIYGGTPLVEAMRHSVDLFSNSEFANHQKLLFILSDGEADDKWRGDPSRQLSNQGVTIVSCFITNQQLSDPCRLYSILDERWEEPAKFMFRMSSTIRTQDIPGTLFAKRGWTIDIDNNETRLFFQVNHPDIIKDVCDMAKKAVRSKDTLSNILSKVDLDLYINQANDGFEVKEKPEYEATCYAYASATVLHLAMQRIVGRDGGYPDFFELRDKLIDKYGIYGAKTIEVLQEVCPAYRLQCKVVDDVGAMKAISEKRPVVARFGLTGAQWDQFNRFYEQNPGGILTRSFLDSGSHLTSTPPHGHAVVLTSYDAESLRLMNSEGDDWADNGFFRVQNADVLGLKFVDVFWESYNLSANEKKAYKEHGPEIAAKLMRSLKGLQLANYKCPFCAIESKVVDYSGHMLEAKCPACGGTFNANKAGGDLALNLYLLSLSH